MSFMKDFAYLKIQMKDVVLATNNFDPTMVIGSGGFGSVYKGELSSPEGQTTVAFKHLDCRLGQGNTEFWKEIMMLFKYKHENLVTLKNFCIDGDDMILVYEYASRGSLDRYLNDATTLNWIQRLKICVGAARGLRFLHDPKKTQQRVLHRDVKSANILLDEKWTAKVSDFGLSKLGPANQTYTYLASHVVGTPGYCDPLYWEQGFLSKESDVFSFGVVLFEILCGRLCYESRNRALTYILVPEWRQCYEERRLDEIILPGLKEQMDPGSLKSFSAIAYQCVKKAREERPMMAQVMEELEFALECCKCKTVLHERFDNTPESSHRERTSLTLNLYDYNRFLDRADDDYSRPQQITIGDVTYNGDDSHDSEDDGLHIVGDATPGGTLSFIGYLMPGTSTCTFQWIRHFEDGNWKYIEGATHPQYVVTADDVHKLISHVCVPMDDQGRQGKVVQVFANKHNKIECDPKMQQEIDHYMLSGEASFSVLLLMDSSQSWEQATFSLRPSKYEIKINRTQDIFMNEKYSNDILIKIPSGITTQITLTSPNGSSHTFSFQDFRRRDTFVLTMRMFLLVLL